jgi:RHS repeat-associated protein
MGGVPFRYVGMYYDAETGLYYDRARYYSSALGRFLQDDPVGYKVDLDLYTYVGNDPEDRTDPSGKCPACIGALIGAGIDYGEQVVGNINPHFDTSSVGGFTSSVSKTFASIKTSDFTNINKTEVAESAAFGAVGGVAGKVVGEFVAAGVNKLGGALAEKALMKMPIAQRLMAMSNAITPNAEQATTEGIAKLSTMAGAVATTITARQVRNTLMKDNLHNNTSSQNKDGSTKQQPSNSPP